MKELRKKLTPILIGIVLFSLLPWTSQAQEPIASWRDKYDLRSLVRVSYQIVDSGGVGQVFLQLDFREGLNLSNYQFFYGLTNEFEPGNVSFIDLDLGENTIFQEPNLRVLKLNLPSKSRLPILILKIHNLEEEVDSYYDIILQSPFLFDHSDLSLWINSDKEFLFSDYISTSDSVVIRSTRQGVATVFGYLYRYEFPAADPPVFSSVNTGKSLTIDSVFTLPVGKQLLLSQPGLYFIQTDSASFAGRSILVTYPAFPGSRNIDDLIDPLIYVSTKEETQRLRNAPEKKTALDKFLMDLTRSKDRAKLFVRHYFRRVSESNQLFTNYKEGWKTDKGMIYILMGVPDGVNLQEDRELWTYNLPTGEVEFTFVRVKSIFSANHHRLLRDKSYDRIWFGVVDQWRKGKFRF